MGFKASTNLTCLQQLNADHNLQPTLGWNKVPILVSQAISEIQTKPWPSEQTALNRAQFSSSWMVNRKKRLLKLTWSTSILAAKETSKWTTFNLREFCMTTVNNGLSSILYSATDNIAPKKLKILTKCLKRVKKFNWSILRKNKCLCSKKKFVT